MAERRQTRKPKEPQRKVPKKKKKKKKATACDTRERQMNKLTLFRISSKRYDTPDKLTAKLYQDIYDRVLADRANKNLVQCKDSKCAKGRCFQGYELAKDIKVFRTKIGGGWKWVARYSGRITHFCACTGEAETN